MLKAIARSIFAKMSKEEITANLPFAITVASDIVGYVVKPEDVLVIGDLHPRVKIQLKAREALARRGMPLDANAWKTDLESRVENLEFEPESST